MTIHKVDVLCYLEESNILRLTLLVNDLIDEQQLLYKIFDRCTLEEVRQIEKSCCQILNDDETENDVLSVLASNSKFWFPKTRQDDNPHPTDVRHIVIKNEYISNMSN